VNVGTPERGAAVVDRPLDARTEPTDAATRVLDDPTVLFPLELRVEPMAAMCNAELVDHPVYDGIEVQRFDDDVHGCGVLAFLARRDGGTVDYYVTPSLRVDPGTYHLAGGTGAWTVSEELAEARLEVTDLGLEADVRFTDVDGREVEFCVDDRLAGRRHPGVLLAPVSAAIDDPTSLLLVYLHGFDLVRRVRPDPFVRIEGRLVSTGRLPGAAIHRRHLIKYAAPLTVATLCPEFDGPLDAVDPDADDALRVDGTGRAVTAVRVRSALARAELVLDPPMPSLTDLPHGQLVTGRWHVNVDGATLTGGTWRALRRHEQVELGLDVSRPWEPPSGLPWLFATVTRVMPTFRRWPTTYRWRAEVTLPGATTDQPAWLRSRWERTENDLTDRYRRTTSR
jgi:hypothetical protein